jgi:hypothetical protein
VSGFGPILTPDCPMCGTPMLDLLGPSVITPLCPTEACPVIMWDPWATIAQNLANASEVGDPFAAGTQSDHDE